METSSSNKSNPRAKSAVNYKTQNVKSTNQFPVSFSPISGNSLNNYKSKNDYNFRLNSNYKNGKTYPQSATLSNYKKKTFSDFNSKRKNDSSYNDFFEYCSPFTAYNAQTNIININSKLISDLNTQINNFNQNKKTKKFNYKQTVNLQKLNDYIIYEYTKNRMQINRNNNIKYTTSFRLPLQYRRMGNHGKKEDLIPINNQPKVNLEDILILHNCNLRNGMAKNKVQNFYLKNSLKLKYKKFYEFKSFSNKKRALSAKPKFLIGGNDEVAYKSINIL